MIITRDTHVTVEAPPGASLDASGPAGVWTLTGEALVASDADGPATVLVPNEAVRLLAVDLPLPTRAKRLAALPFAVEELIAEPIDSVHLALGIELSPKRYLVGVVRHDRMAEWIARIEAEGLGHAALVPDALALPQPAAGEWAVELGATRALVRAGDGTGFAIPVPLLRTAWDAAGKPRTIAYGTALPADMADSADALALDPLARRLLAPALDLRQGIYAVRRTGSGFWRRLATVAVLGLLAHVIIAALDTLALRNIANARVAETRELVAARAPGTALPEEGLASAVADLLPRPGAGGGANPFLAAAARLSAALTPLGADLSVRTMRTEGTSLIVDLDSTDPAFAGRVRTTLASGGIDAAVAPIDGGVRITSPLS
ncbi:type II secretion system protein GspL [uncultured Sphingomonas sp.]|uniref:type II secretion system protein GspL n=1 Tax=uncultured Sphingomonas sp. TaxID=158754 RepID=UPI0025E67ACE|nr:type II secretion system protein GspL [uncultured Sphingomonas sp.]